jgi:hypothetical protein
MFCGVTASETAIIVVGLAPVVGKTIRVLVRPEWRG